MGCGSRLWPKLLTDHVVSTSFVAMGSRCSNRQVSGEDPRQAFLLSCKPRSGFSPFHTLFRRTTKHPRWTSTRLTWRYLLALPRPPLSLGALPSMKSVLFQQPARPRSLPARSLDARRSSLCRNQAPFRLLCLGVRQDIPAEPTGLPARDNIGVETPQLRQSEGLL